MVMYGYRPKPITDAAIWGTSGGLAGGIQTMLLREFVDDREANKFLHGQTSKPPFLKKQLKGFGSPSSVFGWGIGTPAAVIGALGLFKGKGVRHGGMASGLFGYGLSAAGTGVFSGALPTAAWKNAIKADPANPVGFVSVNRNRGREPSRQSAPAGENVPSAQIQGNY